MIDSFISNSGKSYSLLGCVVDGKDLKTINEFDQKYRHDADEMAREKRCHVFYNLKKFASSGYEYSQYFLIPIDAVDVEKIPLIFNKKSTDYWIGISYYHDMPDIAYSKKIKIRESYWNDTEMSGIDYEKACAESLRKMGYTDIELTKTSGDQGIDIIAWKDGLKYGIQCKHYEGSVSNKAVQEASAGAKYYDCDVAVVMTNSVFTRSAEELAHKIGVKLWSNNDLYREV